MTKTISTLLLSTVLTTGVLAQYGTFDPKQTVEAKGKVTNVVLDDGDSQYNQVIMEAVKSHWELNEYDFIRRGDLAASGYLPEHLYLMKVQDEDIKTHTSTLLALVSGWKMKKSQTVETGDHGMAGIPDEQMLAWVRMDEQALEDNGTMSILHVYLKHMQDYLHYVADGKITDKTTADRLYSSRTRHVRAGKLVISATNMDKNVSDATMASEFYSEELEIASHDAIAGAVQSQDKNVFVGDVVLTGEYKEKYCFKRIFNAGSGELVYLSETPALHGKKEGFLDEDLKDLARAR